MCSCAFSIFIRAKSCKRSFHCCVRFCSYFLDVLYIAFLCKNLNKAKYGVLVYFS